MEVGRNTEIKVKVTPTIDKTLQPKPTIANPTEKRLNCQPGSDAKIWDPPKLPFCKYASSSFAQRKPNGKLRLFVDIRKLNTLIEDQYNNDSHSVSTLSDAAHSLAGKNIFRNLSFSQAEHCLQMAD